MKKFKLISLISILAITLFLGMMGVRGDYDGSGGTGQGTTGQATGGGSWNPAMYGYYVAVYNSSHQRRGSVKVYENYKEKNLGLTNWIYEDANGNYVSNQDALYNQLHIPHGSTSGDYSVLLNRIDPNVKLAQGDYIIVEPFVYIGKSAAADYKYNITFRGIANTSDTTSCGNGKFKFYLC